MIDIKEIISRLYNWEWANIIQGIGSIWIALIARKALTTWKSQLKAEKQIEFLDDLVNTTHEFVQYLSPAIQMLEIIKRSISCHKGLDYQFEKDVEDKDIAQVISYIKKSGKKDFKTINEYLNKCIISMNKIRSLAVKGQVLGFANYNKCQVSCESIIWQHGRLEAFSYMIQNDSAYWPNKEIQDYIALISQLTSKEIKEDLSKHQIIFLEFVTDTYKSIYK